MNIKQTYFTLTLLLSISHISHATAVKLESPIIAQIDGLAIGIDGETIGMIKQYQSQITTILLGKRTGDGRQGSYNYQGEKYSTQQLRKIENASENHAEFVPLLRKMRSDFEKISEKFRVVVRGVKPLMARLIEESCKKRNRQNSLLVTWSHTEEKNEYELFDHHIRTIADFELFLTDLYNFLGDLAASCPKGQAQFKERVAKFEKVRSFLPSLNASKELEQKFLKQINQALSKLQLQDISANKVRELFNSFKIK